MALPLNQIKSPKLLKSFISIKACLVLGLFIFGNLATNAQEDSSRNSESINGQAKQDRDPLSEVLKARGISLDKIDPTNVQNTKDIIEKTIGEVNKETGATNAYREEVSSSALEESIIIDDPRVADDIVRRLKEGSTFNEAVTEELAENEIQGANEIYGQHIFVNNTIEVYRGSSTGKIPGNYVLGVGDEIAINIFGISQADLVYQIDKDGFIRPSNVPKLYLKGVSLDKAKEIITKRFMMAYRYSSDQIAIDLKTARTINVSIFGQVTREGSYTLSALNSVLNAIVLADGLKGDGSVRNIKILSNGKERTIDVYEFLLSGEVKPEYFLSSNDIIYIPIANKVVEARGQFRRTGFFELKENEGFKDLLIFNEGLTSSGRENDIEIIRKQGGQNILINKDLDNLTQTNYKMYDLDKVTVAYESRRLENYVVIQGAVKNKGRYEFTEGMKISDLLKKGQIEDFARMEVGYLVRKLVDGQFKIIRIHPGESQALNPDANIELQKEDKITILNLKDYVNKYTFSVEGAVNKEMIHEWAPFQTLQLSDAILLAGGLKPNATTFGYLVRQSIYNSEQFEYVFIELRKAVDDPYSEYNINISPNDKIVIPSIEMFYDELFLSIGGAVRTPVRVNYDPSLSLKQIVAMAGGLSYEAATNRIDVYRLEVNENEPTRTLATSITIKKDINEISLGQFELMPYDQIMVRNTPEFDPIRLVEVKGEVVYPGAYAIVGNNYKLSQLIEAAGGLTSEANLKGGKVYRSGENAGYVITKMVKAMKKRSSDYNIILNEGDKVTIPRSESVIHIQTKSTRASEIYTKDATSPIVNVAYKKGRRARHYISNYVGGFAKRSKKSKTVVETKSGQIKKTHNFLLFKVYPIVEPGSTILVQQKPVKPNRTKEAKARRSEQSLTERLLALQTIVTVATSTVTTAVTTVLLVKELNK